MKTFIIAICLVVTGSAFASGIESKTAGENQSISQAVEDGLSPRLAELILTTPYDGFYQINGKMKRGGDYRFTSISNKKSFPDDRWETLAKDVAKRVNFSGNSNSIGSRTRPSATAYVIMFKDGIEGIKHTGEGESLALVMIDQNNASNPNMPTIKASGKALYLMDLSMQ